VRLDDSAAAREGRYAEERRQGEAIVADHLEHVWGWTTAAGRVRAARRATFLAERAGLQPGIRCLEIGCGTGEFTVRLAETGCSLVALELSEATAAVCRGRVGDRVEVVVGNIETGEDLAGRRFDAVVGISVLHHVDLDAALSVIRSVLEPGGRYAFSEPNHLNPQVWAERRIEFVRRARKVTAHETAFRADTLRADFEHAGFVVDVCEPFEFLHPATPGPAIPAVEFIERLIERTPLRAIAGSIRIAGRVPGP